MHDVATPDAKGIFTFLPTEDVHYGAGSVAGLGAALAKFGVKRALLVTGTTLATKTDLVERVRAAADGRIAAVFHDTIQHVHRASVINAINAARAIDADGIVSFGGGSANDTGKAVVLGLAEGVRHSDDFDRYRVRFEYPTTVEVPPINGTPVPMLAVSTTLSAGEFTHFTGMTDSDRQVKDLYIDKKMAARAVFLDAELTLATPDWLWLSTGMRSVDHCVEALCSSKAHPYADAMAARALNMLNRALRRCKADARDLDARTQAHIAAWMSVSGLANVSLGLSHGIGHQLGARNDVPHGVTSCVMMVPTMEFNREHTEARQAWIAEIMDRDVRDLESAKAAAQGRDAVRQLVTDLELPQRLRDVGVAQSDFPALAKDALEDMVVATNPRPVTSVEDVIELLHSAW
jgi:alcohol dehydrogenase class IV